MIGEVRLVRDLRDGSVHRTDCPFALLVANAHDLVPFDGLELTLAGEEWSGAPAAWSRRLVRWCPCVVRSVADALARRLEQEFRSEQIPDLIGRCRLIAVYFDRRLDVIAHQELHSTPGADGDPH